MGIEDVILDLSLPSCAICTARLETEIGILPGIKEAVVRSAPVRIRAHCGAGVGPLKKLIMDLKKHGYEVRVEKKQFRIPPRPALPPMLWSVKVENLAKNVRGVISASIDFAASRISIEYLAGVLSGDEIRMALMG